MKKTSIKVLVSIILIFGTCFNLSAQNKLKGLPDDLNKEVIVFLLQDTNVIVTINGREIKEKQKGQINKAVIEYNKAYMECVKDYPFEYILMKRSEFYGNPSVDCKYAFKIGGMENSFEKKTNAKLVSNINDIYIEDLISGQKYLIKKMEGAALIPAEYYINKFIKMVNKKYKL